MEQFFFDLAWITPEDRAAFVQLGPMFAKLARIAEAETERLRRWVYVIHALFERHFSEQLMSSQGLPVVGAEELGDLMTEGLNLVDNPTKVYAPPTDHELTRFIKFMDKDQDGLIDEQELICFCVQGLRQTPEANLAFASRSTMHAKLIGFLDAINEFSGADAVSQPFDQYVPAKRSSHAASADLAQYKQSETLPAVTPVTPGADAQSAVSPVPPDVESQPDAAEEAQPAAAEAQPAAAEAQPDDDAAQD